MKLFSYCYQIVMRWASHRHAPFYLAGLSFSESVFFPVPVDVMLAPMVLSTPQRAVRFTIIATLFSVLGGMVGYALGYMAYEPIVLPFIEWMGYEGAFETIVTWLRHWGFWVILVAGFSPIPYKLFTVGAGLLAVPLLPFLLASVIARSARYVLVASIMVWGGARMEKLLHQYVDAIGWAFVALTGVAYILYQVFAH